MSTLHVRLFGKLHVEDETGASIGIEARKVQELFCYLLVHHDHAHARETLAGMLCGETSTAQSKKALRQTLWQLQTALEPHLGAGAPPLLQADAEWIQLSQGASIEIDVLQFEHASEMAQGRAGADLDALVAHELERAVGLYSGDLLEGWYQDWCLFERERLQNMYFAMLDKLMGYCEASGSYEAGITYGQQVLRYDRAHERTHRKLMSLHYRSGDRAAALRQYDRCVAALREELGVEPAKSTVALLRRIQADQLDEPAMILPQMAGTVHGKILARLKQVAATLDQLQRQVREEIVALEAGEEG